MTKPMRYGLVALAVTVGVLLSAAPASAHVTVNPREATQGSYARLAFRVPTESDTLSTTELEVHLPEDVPITSVSTMPVPGWAVEVTRTTLDEPIERGDRTITEVVSVITWTAEDAEAELAPGEFGEFPVSLGPLPDDADQLVFKALQTYSDDSVVRWIEEPAEGQELERPAPVLTLTAGAGEDAHGASSAGSDSEENGAAAGEDSEVAQATGETDPDSGSGSGAALWLALAALVAALGGLALGGVAFARTRG